jgi:hypothetical protein
MGTRGSFLGVMRQGHEADHSLPTSAEVKKMWFYTSTPPYVFMGQLYLLCAKCTLDERPSIFTTDKPGCYIRTNTTRVQLGKKFLVVGLKGHDAKTT